MIWLIVECGCGDFWVQLIVHNGSVQHIIIPQTRLFSIAAILVRGYSWGFNGNDSRLQDGDAETSLRAPADKIP